MTKTKLSTPGAACAVLLALTVVSTGCQSSGGGSRWAWNPWKKSPAVEAELVAETSPKLPSDGATPQVETLAKPGASTAVAVAMPQQTPPAMMGVAPKFDAVAAAVPTIDKAAPSGPNWSAYPTSPSSDPSKIAATATPSLPAAKTAPAASGSGPYDPNGYQPKVVAATPSTPSADRYGLGDRYAATTAAAGLPSLPAIKDAASTADRYSSTASSNISQATQSVQQTAQQAADRYAATGAQATSSAQNWYDNATTTASAAPAKAVAAATAAVASAPTYPSTSGVASAAPAASPYPTTGSQPAATGYPSTLGTLPPAGSAYAATTPINPVTPASTTAPSTGNTGSEIRLTSLPGEYRPGGTGTYQSPVSVATRPEGSTSTPPATTPASRY
ncbi:hypothetical protein Pla108_00950 [Botrimarina colliarenosi]|uniref:Uncharacterized protein n=1 Tax=Botrimarina colliarenosi TaxID=2528001 RepID=A0A5C6AJF4_9BACT|nr:hypothetical protein [Botrimarina colliarenosi]TWT99161.1 hypothetical protein Pla108_00950 [Botrimarina colliarenosi]